MKQGAEPEVLGGLNIFEKTCVYCGAQFRVLASVAPAGNHAERYFCPQCRKSYRIQAVGEPSVSLLRGRTDGRDDPYQDTMF
jgi:hypothetical protein